MAQQKSIGICITPNIISYHNKTTLMIMLRNDRGAIRDGVPRGAGLDDSLGRAGLCGLDQMMYE